MWESLVQHISVEAIMNDKGLAQIGDNLVNFCYSLAKSVVLNRSLGEKVRDTVLARAIRATEVYKSMGRRTDVGKSGDAYEAIMAWLWLTGQIDISTIVRILSEGLKIDSSTGRKLEAEIAARAFQELLEQMIPKLPKRGAQ
jgi:hypothetical protein